MVNITHIVEARKSANKLTILQLSRLYEEPLSSMAEYGCYRIEMRKHINTNSMKIGQMNNALIEVTKEYYMEYLPCVYQADSNELRVIIDLLSDFIHVFEMARNEIEVLAEEIVELDAALNSTGLMY